MPTKSKAAAPRSIHHRVKRHAKLALIPHAANQFRPHLVRRHGLIAVLVLVIAAQFFGNAGLSRSVLGDSAPVKPAELLSLTNGERGQAGIAPLTSNQILSDAAFLKAKDMFDRQYWAHNAPDGTQPWKWFGDVGYNYAYAGENLAKNFSSPQAIVSAWMDSKAHKENILKSQYTEVGFAVVDGLMSGVPTTIVVAFYGTPAAAAVQGVGDVSAATAAPANLLTRLGVAVQSFSPTAIGSIILLLFTAVIALVAHANRRHLPRSLRQTWYRHHGAYKALGLTSIVFIIVALYETAGQI